jgi:glutaredoxin-related protein
MQNRNGNTPESYDQLSIIKSTIEQCKALNIQIGIVRIDACGFEEATIKYLESQNITYYIRAEKNEALRIALEDENEWQPVLHNHCKIEVCSMEEKLFGKKKPLRRIVAYRKKLNAEQATIFDADGYRYHAIVTSDKTAIPIEVIDFYNQRGCEGEHHFKELDHDFGWKKLPFSTFEMNTIFMYVGIVAYILFQYFKSIYASMRLKNFTLHFVTLTAKWVHRGRRWVLQLFTQKDYAPIWIT